MRFLLRSYLQIGLGAFFQELDNVITSVPSVYFKSAHQNFMISTAYHKLLESYLATPMLLPLPLDCLSLGRCSYQMSKSHYHLLHNLTPKPLCLLSPTATLCLANLVYCSVFSLSTLTCYTPLWSHYRPDIPCSYLQDIKFLSRFTHSICRGLQTFCR